MGKEEEVEEEVVVERKVVSECAKSPAVCDTHWSHPCLLTTCPDANTSAHRNVVSSDMTPTLKPSRGERRVPHRHRPNGSFEL